MYLMLGLAALMAALMPSSLAAAPLAPLQPVSSADEHLEKDARDAIIARVKSAIAANDFAALAAMDGEFGNSRARTPAGTWNLRVFHLSLRWELGEGLDAEGRCTYRRAPFVARWRAAQPRDPAGAITDAALLLDQAWCLRGDGYASSVPEDAWPKFSAKVAAAAAVLGATRKDASADPEFFVTEIKAIRANGEGERDLAQVVAEAAAREPTYDPIYSAAAFSLLPQWGGSYAEIDALARAAAEKSGPSDGAGFYFRVYQSLEECGCDAFGRSADWELVKQGMRDIYARYPVRFNAEDFAKLACRMGDGQEGRRYIRALHPEATGEGDFVALFGSCDMQAGMAAR